MQRDHEDSGKVWLRRGVGVTTDRDYFEMKYPLSFTQEEIEMAEVVVKAEQAWRDAEAAARQASQEACPHNRQIPLYHNFRDNPDQYWLRCKDCKISRKITEVLYTELRSRLKKGRVA